MASLDCLTIDTASRWMLVSSASMTNPHSERVMQPAPGAIVPPLPEVGVNTLPSATAENHSAASATGCHPQSGREWHQPPGRISRLRGRPPGLAAGNQMLDNKPLAVSQICWVSFCFHRDYVYHNLADSLYFSNSLLEFHRPSRGTSPALVNSNIQSCGVYRRFDAAFPWLRPPAVVQFSSLSFSFSSLLYSLPAQVDCGLRD